MKKKNESEREAARSGRKRGGRDDGVARWRGMWRGGEAWLMLKMVERERERRLSVREKEGSGVLRERDGSLKKINLAPSKKFYFILVLKKKKKRKNNST